MLARLGRLVVRALGRSVGGVKKWRETKGYVRHGDVAPQNTTLSFAKLISLSP